MAVTSVKLIAFPCHRHAGRTFAVNVALLFNFISAISLYSELGRYSGCPIICAIPKSCISASVLVRYLSPIRIMSGGILLSYKFKKILVSVFVGYTLACNTRKRVIMVLLYLRVFPMITRKHTRNEIILWLSSAHQLLLRTFVFATTRCSHDYFGVQDQRSHDYHKTISVCL